MNQSEWIAKLRKNLDSIKNAVGGGYAALAMPMISRAHGLLDDMEREGKTDEEVEPGCIVCGCKVNAQGEGAHDPQEEAYYHRVACIQKGRAIQRRAELERRISEATK